MCAETKDLGNKLAQVIGIMQMRGELKRKLNCQIVIFKRVAINNLPLIEYSAKKKIKENFIVHFFFVCSMALMALRF